MLPSRDLREAPEALLKRRGGPGRRASPGHHGVSVGAYLAVQPVAVPLPDSLT